MSVMAGTWTLDGPARLGLQRLAEQLETIGLRLWVYGPETLLAGGRPCEACTHLCGAQGPGAAWMADLAAEVRADGEPRVLAGQAGCVVLAAPVRRRRRLVAVALACYFTPDAGSREAFARLCDRRQLDRAYLADAIAQMPTHAQSEGPHLLTMLTWLIEQHLDSAVAQGELATLSTNLASTYEELALLYRVSGATRVSTRPSEFFQGLCQELLDVMRIEGAAVILTDRLDPDRFDQVVRAGQLGLDDEQLRSLVRRHVARRLDGGAQSLVENDLTGQASRLSGTLRNFIVVPLTVSNQTKGLLLGANKAEGDFDSVDLKLINSVGDQASVYLANQHLYEELQELLMGVLHVLTASIDAKDQYTCGHSQRVALISRRLAEMCGLDPARVRNVYLAGLLHDVGKIGVPESVLCKTGRLTNEEFDVMKRHPVIGARILSNIRQMQDMIPGLLHHHERCDGRGYPEGLTGHQTPLEGRIVGLADGLDAMTSSRTYRKALPIGTVKAEIIRCSGTQFDPELVDHLLSLDLAGFLHEIRQEENKPAAIQGTLRGEAARHLQMLASRQEGVA